MTELTLQQLRAENWETVTGVFFVQNWLWRPKFHPDRVKNSTHFFMPRSCNPQHTKAEKKYGFQDTQAAMDMNLFSLPDLSQFSVVFPQLNSSSTHRGKLGQVSHHCKGKACSLQLQKVQRCQLWLWLYTSLLAIKGVKVLRLGELQLWAN